MQGSQSNPNTSEQEQSRSDETSQVMIEVLMFVEHVVNGAYPSKDEGVSGVERPAVLHRQADLSYFSARI